MIKNGFLEKIERNVLQHEHDNARVAAIIRLHRLQSASTILGFLENSIAILKKALQVQLISDLPPAQRPPRVRSPEERKAFLNALRDGRHLFSAEAVMAKNKK